MSKNISWDDERDERLRQLHAQSYNAEEVANALAKEYEDLAAITRNAVLGRLFRLGLSIPRSEVGERARSNVLAATRSGSTRPRRQRNKTTRPAQPLPRKREPVQVIDLLAHHCRWPVTPERPWGFCGANQMPNSPYCYMHAMAAFSRQGK
jgi:hypothetical protein